MALIYFSVISAIKTKIAMLTFRAATIAKTFINKGINNLKLYFQELRMVVSLK